MKGSPILHTSTGLGADNLYISEILVKYTTKDVVKTSSGKTKTKSKTTAIKTKTKTKTEMHAFR